MPAIFAVDTVVLDVSEGIEQIRKYYEKSQKSLFQVHYEDDPLTPAGWNVDNTNGLCKWRFNFISESTFTEELYTKEIELQLKDYNAKMPVDLQLLSAENFEGSAVMRTNKKFKGLNSEGKQILYLTVVACSIASTLISGITFFKEGPKHGLSLFGDHAEN